MPSKRRFSSSQVGRDRKYSFALLFLVGFWIHQINISIYSLAHMSRFRFLLLWLMMIALPLQGFAAASMLYCGTGIGHHSEALAIGENVSHNAVVELNSSHHEVDEHSASESSKQSPVDHKQSSSSTHKCGICAACCCVIAMSEFAPTVGVHSAPQADMPEPFVLIDSHPSRLLEKPPRV